MKKISLLTIAFTLVLFQYSTVFAQSSGKFEAIYTDLTAEKCKTIESEAEGAGWYRGECPGVGGYKLELLEGDIRQTINVIAPNGNKSELNFWSDVSSAFSAVGEKAEWRVPKNAKNVRPYALIIRYNTNEDPEVPEKITSRLIVSKITPTSACITDIVEPIKNANEKARELADASANKPCKFEEEKNSVDSDGQVKQIEAYAKTIQAFVEKEQKPHLVIADVADYNNAEKAIWKMFKSEEEFEEARETEEAYEIAYIWKKDGKIVAANFTYSSPSGDWAQYVYYVFREDGSTARADRELRTFLGDIIVNRIHIYDEAGKLLKETKTFRDLATQEPVKANENFQDIDVDIYKNVKNLPFASML